MLEKFDDWNPVQRTLDLIDAAKLAYEDMRGYEPTLRSIYYQLVANDVIANKQSEYKRLGDILVKARNAGLFPWDALQDKQRSASDYYIQPSPQVALQDVPWGVALDYWEGQETYVEVWVEKQAQEGVVKRMASRYHVPWMSCKGYVSATAAYDAGKRFAKAQDDGKRTILIHLGDHDPSGIDMTRDNGERPEKYGWLMDDLTVDRIALNMDQIEEHRLSPDPVKFTDSRATGYEARFGKKSWELDAIKPQIMEPILEQAILRYIDVDMMRDVMSNEEDMRADLQYIGDNADYFLEHARGMRGVE